MKQNIATTLFGLALLIPLAFLSNQAIAQDSAPKDSQASTPTPTLPDSWVKQLQWRSVGPANMMGRITSISVFEKDPSVWWAATASGGLLKTENNGVTFEHQFDQEATVSIGDVQVAQSDKNIVWVGTGEANPRNSVSWGNGVYKSTDGGKTWKNMGLEKTFQIGRIAVHPTNPDIVYVGALGRLWGESEERGLYKTSDGGKSWKKILSVDDKTGVIDVQMNLSSPDTLYVATYERKRDGFDGNDPEKKYGEGSGIHRTKDGGKTWKKLGKGLPTCKLGRMGIQVWKKDPKFIFAIIESEKIGKMHDNAAYAGINGADAEIGAKLTNVSANTPAAKAGLKTGDIILKTNGKLLKSYSDFTALIGKSEAGDKVKLEIIRNKESKEIELVFGKAPASNTQSRRGRTPRNKFTGTLGGQAANLQDQQGKNGFEHGGVYMSKDEGESWTRINTLNPRPMYYSQLRVDPSDWNYMYVLGTSLYRSKDGGKTFTRDGGNGIHPDNHAMWIDGKDGRHMILGNDGGVYVTWDRMDNWDHHAHVAIGQFYHVGIDSRRNYNIYGGLQDNGSWGGPSRSKDGRGSINSDWFRVGGGDGFICLVDPEDPDQIYFESQNGSMGRIHLKTGERGFIRPRREQGLTYRWNWKTPFILSPHNSKIHYSAGNYVFRSLYKGNGIERISPEITNTDRGAGSAISESAVKAGVIYAGTTDGGLWMTSNGGKDWMNCFKPDDTATPAPQAQSLPARGRGQGGPGGGAGQRGQGQRGAGGGQRGTGQRGPGQRGAGPAERGGQGQEGASPEERANSRFKQLLEEQDTNKDGKLQKSEASEQMQRFFDRLDQNKDGVLEESEFPRFGGRGGSGRGGRGGAGRGGSGRGPEGGRGGNRARPTQDDDGPTAKSNSQETQPQEKKDEDKKEDPKKADTDKSADKKDDDKSKPAIDDIVSGVWDGKFLSDQIPAERAAFTLTLRLQKDGSVKGKFESTRTNGDFTSGKYDPKTKKLTGTVDSEFREIDVTGTVAKGTMKGELEFGGQFQIEFEAKRTGDALTSDAADSTDEKSPGTSIAELMPKTTWISSLEASKFAGGRCYVTFDGHRSNDDAPHVFVTEDYGKTWASIQGNLPMSAGSTRVIREDVRNQNVLYLGCEFSAWVSIDRGKTWTKMNNNLPTVSVHEFAISRAAGEMVAATHGRSLWILDIYALQQFTPERVKSDAYLYQPNSVVRWRNSQSRGESGTRRFVGTDPSTQAQIYYSLGKDAREVKMTITDIRGQKVFEATSSATPAPTTTQQRGRTGRGATSSTKLETKKGLQKVTWNLRRSSSAGQGGRGRRGGGTAGAGTYLITLTVDSNITLQQNLTIESDPDAPASATSEEEYELMKAIYGEGEDEEESGDQEESVLD